MQTRSDIKVGDTAELRRRFTQEDVNLFAKLCGDTNPIHTDAAYSAKTPFGRNIVHGALTAGLISTVLAQELPGPGTIYLSQTTKFLKPVFVGDEVRVCLTVLEIRADKGIYTLDTSCFDMNGIKVVEGTAVVVKK